MKTLRYFGLRFSALESKTKNTHNKMDKKRLRVALKVLDEVKVQFPETEQFIECIEQECVKENIYNSRSKELAQKKHFLFCSEYVMRYCIILNLLGYNIYLRVI